MKIVINACYGGFGLSEEGMRVYAERKGLTLYPESVSRLSKTYWLVPESERSKCFGKDWKDLNDEERKERNRLHSEQTLSAHNIERNDPDLVATVESLQGKASSQLSELMVVEIPDGVVWNIEEYDGLEHVAEDHRTWP